MTHNVRMLIQRPSREFVQAAVESLEVYAIYRQTLGRRVAFDLWCTTLELSSYQRAQLAHLRVQLLLDMSRGKIDYDDIDWSGADEDRRASSTGVEWVETLDAWLGVTV